MVGARSGQAYRHGLSDAREVWLGNGRVTVTEDARLSGSLAGIAGYFDWQHAHGELCLIEDPDTGASINVSHVIPRSRADLERRHVALECLSRYSVGVLGRTPDYVNVTLAGFAGRPDIFGMNGDSRAVEALLRYQRDVALGDLALTHTIVHPVVNKAVGDVMGENGELSLRVVSQNESGIVVRGARVLATLGPFADELFVYPGQPLPKDADPAFAVAFAIPMATAGLTVLCRDHYGASGDVSDHPFSSRFDEQDAFVIFDDVEVPWERVFIDRDLQVYNRIMGSGWTGNVMQQTTIRAAVKLEFAYELATRMAEAQNSAGRPDVQQMLGEIWCHSALARAALRAAEADAYEYGAGTFFCDDRPFRAIRATMPGWMARTNEIIKLLGAHNLLATPTAAAFDGELGDKLARYLPGALGMPARERARLFRAAWDFVGSALGGRNELYERFYLASAARTLALSHMLAQREREWTQVPEFLARLR